MSSTASALNFFDSTKDDSTAPEIFRCEHHSDGVLKRLENFLDNKELYDVVLVAGNEDKRVNAHRLILSGASEYFSAMFFGSMLESKMAEVKLQNVSGDALELLVHYCYTGIVELREDTVESLLVAADIFQLNDVVTACWKFFESRLHPTNCLGIGFFAEQRSYEKLIKSAKSFVHQHFVEVSKNEEFLQLSLNQLTELIASDELCVTSEEDVFRSIMKWIEHDSAARKQHFDELLGVIRLPLLQSDFIAKFVNPVCVTIKSKELLLDEFHCRSSSEFKSLQINRRIRSGPFHRVLLAVNRQVFKIQCYCPQTNKWTLWNTPEYALNDFNVAVMSDSLIIVGGGYPATNTVMSLNLKTKTLTAFSSLATKRWAYSVVSLHDSLYVIGGYDAIQFLDSVERWDPVARSWSEFYDPLAQLWKNAASMNVARYGHGVLKIQCFCSITNKWTLWNTPKYAVKWFHVAVMSDSLIIVGGYPETNIVMSLNLKTKTLTAIPSLTTKRRLHSVVSLHGSLYVIGGSDGSRILNSVERLDPLARSWSFIKPMQTSRRTAAVAVLNEHVYVVGGFGESSGLNAVEFYDPLAQLWKNAASMNVARWGHGVAVVNGHLYAVGGDIDFSMERYDSQTNTWTMMSTTNAPHFASRNYFSCTSTDNRIVVADGVNCVGEYDTITNVWKELPQHADVGNAVDLVTVASSLASKHFN